MKKPIVLSIAILFSLVNLLPIVRSATAQEAKRGLARDVIATPTQQPAPNDPAELKAFFDDLLRKQMEEFHIAGAAVSVVKDGKPIFSKGYGYADLEHQIPVDPEQTIFRIGSIGKLFTWTAVMQLVEQGKLDLDADINSYLDFRIRSTYPQPITLKHLMTHTSGLEDRWLESVTSNANELLPAREWLMSNFPGQVRPPGEAAGYSNYNAMLAGYIVARVSGQPYEQYIEDYILNPLGMTHSTARSPVSPELRRFVSLGYTFSDGSFQAFPDYLAQPAVVPSGFHQASATDMARFMIAHLENGRYSDTVIADAHILKENTAQQMQRTLYSPDPRLLGIAYGFFDMSDNGQQTLGHQGYGPPMSSLLLLLPDQRLGIFVVYNSLGARDGGLTTQHYGFQKAFFDHYYPSPRATAASTSNAMNIAERANHFVGLYRLSNSHATTPEKVIGLFGALEVSSPGDGTLLIPIEGIILRFAEVEPLYFRQVDGPFALVFREDAQGRVTYLFTDLQPQYALVKLEWYETPNFNLALAAGCILVFLSILPVTLIAAIRPRRHSGDRISITRNARMASLIIQAVCFLNLLFLIGIALWFRPMRPSELHRIPLIVEIVLGMGVVAALLTVGALVYAVLAWRNRYWGIAGRAYYSLVTVAAIAFVWFLNYWNWLGWRY